MYRDEVIEEVWRIRDEYVARHHHSLDEIVADLRRRQVELPEMIVDQRHGRRGITARCRTSAGPEERRRTMGCRRRRDLAPPGQRQGHVSVARERPGGRRTAGQVSGDPAQITPQHTVLTNSAPWGRRNLARKYCRTPRGLLPRTGRYTMEA